MIRWISLGCLITFLAAGCGKDKDEVTEAEQACLDLAVATGDLCERCQSGSYQDCYDGVVDLVNGCGNVKQIRDMDEYYNTCLPWFDTVDCEEVTSGTFELDDSCKGQLLV